ncbi:MAG TPA: PLP-dependent aminotransferase family protein [Gaiellaceae bacterium]|nr:PLP-dependent aminotransferase family protein [Gaiellaceae bacterium]
MTTISLARGVPPPELLPYEELADCARAAILAEGSTLLNYGPVSGYEPLRAWVAERHGVDASRVILTPGSLPGLAILAQVLLAEGRRAIVEAPSYDRPLRILEGLGADIATVALSDDGIDVDALEAELAGGGPAFLYAIPTFQNPSGRTYSEATRRDLLELARSHDLLILEDDPYRLVRFGAEPPPTLYELAGGDGVVYAASFSKIVAPGLRVGYLIRPPDRVAAVEARAVGTYLSPTLAMQAMLYEFLRRGLLDANLERARTILHERRDALVGALEQHLGPRGASWSHPDGGYFVWLDFPEGVAADEVFGRAADAGVAVVKGSDFFPRASGGQSSLRLAYSFVPPAALADAVERLAGAVPAAAAV